MVYASALGLEMALVYDLFRIVRRVWKSGFWVNTCMDMAFWGFTAFRTFYIMHTYSDGTLRWFAILGVLAVWSMYMKCFSRYIVAAGVFLLSGVKKIFIRVHNFLTKVFNMVIMKTKIRWRRDKHNGKKNSVSDKVS